MMSYNGHFIFIEIDIIQYCSGFYSVGSSSSNVWESENKIFKDVLLIFYLDKKE